MIAACRAAQGDREIDGPIPAVTQDLIVGVTDAWSAMAVTLRRYRKASPGGRWTPVGKAWVGSVGKAGLAWGVGLHGTGAPRGRAGPVKIEGDRAAPAGVFAIAGSYGAAVSGPGGARIPYTHATEDWVCVDDPKSASYNRVVDRRTIAADYASRETMKRTDGKYDWVIDVRHNPANVPGAGSCIFFHVWAAAGEPTVGCTAMPEPEIAMLVGTLDPSAVYVLLPSAEYAALAPTWHLPVLF